MNFCEALKKADKGKMYIFRNNETDYKHEGFRKIVVAEQDSRTDFYVLMSCGIGRGLNLTVEDYTADDWETGELTPEETENIKRMQTVCGWY